MPADLVLKNEVDVVCIGLIHLGSSDEEYLIVYVAVLHGGREGAERVLYRGPNWTE